jgi:type I restriction enzyme R subunit
LIRIDIDRDIEGWTPPRGMVDDLGNEVEQREYNQKDMDRILILNQRTKLVAERVMKLLRATDPMSKTIIFCEDIDHAERMRKATVNAASDLSRNNSKYVMRITGDSVEGKAELDRFIDPEEPYPVIATTSQLLTTGVDAKICKLIVIDRTINSMSMFKQIIGRGTRIDEDNNKLFFTIMDFKKATDLFRDPEFDGEPVVIYEPKGDDDLVPPDPDPEGQDGPDSGSDDDGGTSVTKIRIGGVDAKIIAERIEYIGPDGRLITESYREFARKQIVSEYRSLDQFMQKWRASDRRESEVRTGAQRSRRADLWVGIGADYQAVASAWPRRGGPTRWPSVWRRREVDAQEIAVGRVLPAYACASPEWRFCAIYRHQNQYSLLHQGRSDQGYLVLRASLSGRRDQLQPRPNQCSSRNSSPNRIGGELNPMGSKRAR